jgi:malate synthase
MLTVLKGVRTLAGLIVNFRVGVQYIEAWLRGRGAVPLYNLMEDAATAEISRAQVWQWISQGATLDDGRVVTADLFKSVLEEEMAALKANLPAGAFDGGRFGEAIALFSRMSLARGFEEFLTLPAYDILEA